MQAHSASLPRPFLLFPNLLAAPQLAMLPPLPSPPHRPLRPLRLDLSTLQPRHYVLVASFFANTLTLAVQRCDARPVPSFSNEVLQFLIANVPSVQLSCVANVSQPRRL